MNVNSLTLQTKLARNEFDLNNNQTNEVTGLDEVDLAKEIETLLGDAAGQVSTAGAPQPIEVDVAGHKLKFDDNKQLSQRLTEIVTNYNATQQELQALRSRQTQAPPAASTQPPQQGFSNDQFSQLLQSGEKGVAEALNYAMSHMFFDGKVPDAAKTIAALLQQSAATAQDLTVLRFKDAHPELPRTAETGTILESIRNKYNLPFTPEGLEASYALAKHHGALQPQFVPESNQPATPQYTPQQAMNNAFTSPVMSRQSSGQPQINLTDAQLDRAWEMPLDQLEKLVYKYRNKVTN